MDENGHIYVGERCVFCNVNVYDNSLFYDDAPCSVVAGVDREPLVYTTETGGVDSPLPQWLD